MPPTRRRHSGSVYCFAGKNMNKKKIKKTKIPECKIQEEIMKCLDKAGIYHWRNNVGRKHNLYFGKKGSADITGILKNGIRLEIEVKDRDGKQSDEQIEFERMIKQNNGIYILARSVDDVVDKLFP